MKRARKYNKQIELWQTVIGDDGYGGSVVSYDSMITVTKCRVETFGLGGKYSNRSTDFGLTDTTNAIRILLRKRNDLTYSSLNQFFMYAGEKYIIQNEPLDINYFGSEIEIVAVKEIVKTSTILEPFGITAVYTQYKDRVERLGGTVSSESCLLAYIESIY